MRVPDVCRNDEKSNSLLLGVISGIKAHVI